MMNTPKCRVRECKHFSGFVQVDGTEQTERPVCKAYPKGIPSVIAYGDNLHLKPFLGDRSIQFEKAK